MPRVALVRVALVRVALESCAMNIRPYLGQLPTLGEGVYVDRTASVIGDVVLGDDVSIWPGTVVRGDVNFIRIGARTNIQDGSVVHVSHDGPHAKLGGFATVIGDDVTIYQSVTLGGTNPSTGIGGKRHPTLRSGVVIGSGAQVLGPIDVGAGARVGANAVVTKDVLPSTTVVGIPARPVPIDVVHYSPGFIPYGTPCGEDVDPSRAGIYELEREVKELKREVAALKRARLNAGKEPAPKAKSA